MCVEIGSRFGLLTVTGRTAEREDRYTVWKCRCDCGNECYVNTKRLTRGTVSDCGCIPKPDRKRGPAAADLTGQTFGNLTVLERAENRHGRTVWRCRCSCGNETVVSAHDLRAGHTKSCGCLLRAGSQFRNLTGARIGYLTVLSKTDERDYKGSVCWLCRNTCRPCWRKAPSPPDTDVPCCRWAKKRKCRMQRRRS